MTTRVALTGASGFIGSAVLRRLARHDVEIRALTRREHPLPAQVEQVRADLARPETLRGSCSGSRVLIHAASYVGSDEQLATGINDLGTEALMCEARRAGVERIVQLSTTAVYGRGPHRDVAVGDVDPHPGSAASRSRLAGEAHGLRHGAAVLRAGLVTGTGDRWVVPALAELVRRAPGFWRGGQARLSLIGVEDLARLVTLTALRPAAPGEAPERVQGIHHAVHPVPVRTRELLETLAQLGVLPRVTQDLTWQECLALMEANPGRISERQLALLAFDHHYATDLWEACESAPGPGPLAALADAADWYRTRLALTDGP
ncbi:NAD(P)-dependent oxidoreductase [Streptomyces sp. WMMB 322]|uniref:NAD-dependent epimerase/dehydratase family protein n=1 Tax=Streptomyces sp. WMMB 322 TaxID=1286821 RepID=UPI0006E34CF1|nr:NAD(P)-dependent oxidoreductase [Streptomyces sp. WMMB 322]SCK57017.1 Nucleoside-diphosphate-sugar epimerase [Streptomyces sp. WMMB 322]